MNRILSSPSQFRYRSFVEDEWDLVRTQTLSGLGVHTAWAIKRFDRQPQKCLRSIEEEEATTAQAIQLEEKGPSKQHPRIPAINELLSTNIVNSRFDGFLTSEFRSVCWNKTTFGLGIRDKRVTTNLKQTSLIRATIKRNPRHWVLDLQRWTRSR